MKLPWKRHPRRRGSGLLTVLVASSLLLMLGMTVAGTSFHHLSVSNRLHHAQTARNLAEAAIAKGIAELMQQHDKYKAPNTLVGFTGVDPGTDPSDGGFLTFDPAQLGPINAKLKSARLVASVNNFGSDATMTVDGRTLPGESAYLRAVGSDRGIEKSMECMIYIPKFPWAIASGGKVNISGQSRVAAFKSILDVNDPSKELPGHLVSNSSSLTDALVLQGDKITVTGDAQTSGGADFGQNVIKGERRLHAQGASIPKIEITSYNPSAQAGCSKPPAGAQNSQVTGLTYVGGSAQYTNLNLDGAVLYADGPISISGAITGDGAIISTQGVSITGSGQLTTSKNVAILAKGDLNLQGNSSTDRLQISGIVYSEGHVTTNAASIYGSAISPSTSGMTLIDTNLYATDSAVTVMPPAGSGSTTPLPLDFAFESDTVPPLVVLDMGPPVSTQQIDIQISAQITAPVSRFLDSSTNTYMLRRQTSTAWDQASNLLPPGMYTSMGTPTDYYDIPAPTGPPPLTNADMTVTIGGVPVAGDAPNLLTLAKTQAINLINQQLASQGKSPLSGPTLDNVNQQVDNYLGGNSLIELVAKASIKKAARGMYGLSPGGPTTAGDPLFKLDLNQEDPGHVHLSQYLSRAERIRVLYWRDVLP